MQGEKVRMCVRLREVEKGLKGRMMRVEATGIVGWEFERCVRW